MVTVNIVLRKKKNKKGLCPLAIRITQGKDSRFVHVGKMLDPEFWDEKKKKVKKSFPNSARLNHFLQVKKTEVYNSVIALETKSNRTTLKEFKEKSDYKNQVTAFFPYAEKYLAFLKEDGQLNRHTSDRARLKRLKEFVKKDNLAFEDITVDLLHNFSAWQKARHGSSERTVQNGHVVLRTLFNKAIREGLVSRDAYPFGRGKIVIRFPQSIKIGLTREEIQLLENHVSEENSVEYDAVNAWLFSFNLAGMRVGDLFRLKWSDIRDGRIHYKMGKNDKVVSLKIPEPALEILDKYRSLQEFYDDFVFPVYKGCDPDDEKALFRRLTWGKKNYNKALRELAEQLGIPKKLTMHVARHSFAQLAGDRIPLGMLQQLYRHSEITTTIGYQSHFMYASMDEALEKVLKNNT